MRRKFIPIIGTISAGKSTFLQGLLGTDLLETGATTTTKFVCIIKNAKQTKFYHVIPQKNEEIEFIKEEDNEIIGEENIKAKIKDINDSLRENACTINNIFYMLEIPIKNIQNDVLIEECYFMDIPGLNENQNSYIEIIFSLLTLDDIKFEIIIFDSTGIKQDNIIKIIKKLEEKKCLKKTDNLFILNKIDKVSQNGEANVINEFKQYFYQNFEDDKNKDNSLMINIYKNKFIIMNSLLLLAETKIKDDFYSMLAVEFFNFINSKSKEQFSSFYDYLEKKIEFNLDLLNKQNILGNLDLNSISDAEMEIIKKSIVDLLNVKKLTNASCSIDINIRNKDIKNNMIKLFILHKNKNIYYENLIYYNKLNQILKEINNINNDIIIHPPPNDNKIINLDEQKKEKNYEILYSLDELDNFLKDTFKRIDPNNELKEFNLSLQSIRESIMGRKLRIAFIGNMSVGKSTVLNCIIGKDILPINYSECTYRGLIIRHEENESFKLFKTKMEKRGEGSDEYYYFEDDKIPYCEGIDEIKSFLNVKNNDENITDIDAYLVITGHLKIFEFIKLDQDIISRIEFIDLPGLNRENNTFNEKEYYKSILKFSNCCIYVNDASSIDDEGSLDMITNQYRNDKQKLIPNLRPFFIKTCIFLINKIDLLNDKSELIKIENDVFKNISLIEENLKKDDNMDKKVNISFFSGKSFLEYLDVTYTYFDLLDKHPREFFYKLYDEYHSSFKYLSGNFQKFIFAKISKIEENFFVYNMEENNEEEEKEIEPPEDFINKIKKEIELFEKEKLKLFKNQEDIEVINRLYNLYIKLKNKDYLNNDYSYKFFDDLLIHENLQNNVINFFRNLDILFSKEVKKEEVAKKKEKEQSLEIFVNKCNSIIKNNFIETKINIKKIIEECNIKIFGIIDSEINNASDRLRESNKDINLAFQKLKDTIKTETEKIVPKIKKELFNLKEEIAKVLEELDKKLNDKNMELSISDFKKNIGLGEKMATTFLASTTITLLGETILGEVVSETISATVEGAIGGPIGIAIGFGVGITISLIRLLVYIFKKEKRYVNGLINFKETMKENLTIYKKECLEDLNFIEDDFIKKFNIRLTALSKDIFNIDSEQWEKIKINYVMKKANIMKIVGIQ